MGRAGPETTLHPSPPPSIWAPSPRPAAQPGCPTDMMMAPQPSRLTGMLLAHRYWPTLRTPQSPSCTDRDSAPCPSSPSIPTRLLSGSPTDSGFGLLPLRANERARHAAIGRRLTIPPASAFCAPLPPLPAPPGRALAPSLARANVLSPAPTSTHLDAAVLVPPARPYNPHKRARKAFMEATAQAGHVGCRCRCRRPGLGRVRPSGCPPPPHPPHPTPPCGCPRPRT